MGGSRHPDSPLELDALRFSRLSELLDASIDLEPRERDACLDELENHDPEMAVVLRDLLASREACEAAGFLGHAHALSPWAAAADESALVGKQLGPYRVLALLGHGGMGSVWLAERADRLFSRQVALKLVHPALFGHGMGERLAREREILGSLNHPNIARLLDAGFSEDGQPYLALEYVAGKPFSSYCDERRLSIKERLELFRQVLSAVQYAHAHLVIHRDIKPSNILVTEDGQVQLLDFGIAKLLRDGSAARETELTQLGGRVLTPDYAAPEQIAGAPITTAADIYSLGGLLYEALTGERPYRLKRDSRGALEEAILESEPIVPSRSTPSETAATARATSVRRLTRALKGDLDTIAMKALRKRPGERYATANAFAEDVERFLRGEVVLARRDSMTYRAVKFARRHTAAIASACAVLFTLIGGLAATTYEAKIASGERDSALQAQRRSLTQTAAARLKDGDAPGAMAIILEVLPRSGVERSYTPEALSVFEEARAADPEILALTGHSDWVHSVAFSPDGQRLVTASYDGTVRLWNVASGREIRTLSGHTGKVVSAMFSPDGSRIVTASFDRTARLWDAESGKELRVLRGHADRLRCAAFAPDGHRIVTASYDKTARVWDTATGREVLVLAGHLETVTAAVFSPDGRQIATASYDKTARLWDALTGRTIRVLSGHTDRVTSVAFSPDARLVATASADKTSRLWDTATGNSVDALVGHTQLVASVSFASDGKRVVTASDDKTARIWSVATGQQLAMLAGHTARVEYATFSPDGRYVATASDDDTTRLWDARASRELLALSGHTDPLPAVSFSADGRRIATASFDKTARVWDAATGRTLQTLSDKMDRVICARFSPDGKRIVTASIDKTARIWDADTGRPLVRLDGHNEAVFFAAFSPDGRRVVTSSLDRTARVWDASTGAAFESLKGHTSAVWSAVFSPDGLRILTASDDRTARVWNVATGKEILRLVGHSDGVERADFSPDGRRIVTASDDGTARVWDAATGRELVRLSGHTDEIISAAFSPDGTRIVTGSNDRTARVWDAATGRVLEVLRHPDLVEGAAFSPDGDRVVTASDDAVARVWQLSISPLEAQIAWAEASQFDALPSTERFQLGLPDAARPKRSESARRGAVSSDADALVRLAERSDAAAWAGAPPGDGARQSGARPGEVDTRLLEAFKYYSQAAALARAANWPDAQWRDWRYRRASLARLLARDGMMRQVADTYEAAER